MKAGKNHPKNKEKHNYDLLELSSIRCQKVFAIQKFELNEFVELKEILGKPDQLKLAQSKIKAHDYPIMFYLPLETQPIPAKGQVQTEESQ